METEIAAHNHMNLIYGVTGKEKRPGNTFITKVSQQSNIEEWF